MSLSSAKRTISADTDSSKLSLRNAVSINYSQLLHNSVWVSSPDYAGWLEKKNTSWFGGNSMLFNVWRKKWVILRGMELVYMDKEPTHHNLSEMTMRRTLLSEATVVDPVDSENTQDGRGFAIHSRDDKNAPWHFRAANEADKTNWLVKLKQVMAICTWFAENIKQRVLGVGGQGIVHEMRNTASGRVFAMKEIQIKSEKEAQAVLREASLLRNITAEITHQNIMHIEKVFHVGDKMYLVFPLCSGGELFEAVVRRGHFTEYDAAVIMKDLISALRALHEHNILHLDIKPENILFESDAPDAKIKLTDFGLSKIFSNAEGSDSAPQECPSAEELDKKRRLFVKGGYYEPDNIRGTYGYMSPEVILCGYLSAAADVFAAGVVLYILLCGYPPFNSKSVRESFMRTVMGAYKLEGEDWDLISPDAKDLLRRMLDGDPNTRITPQQVMEHPWITQVTDAPANVSDDTSSRGEAVDKDVVGSMPDHEESTAVRGRSSTLPNAPQVSQKPSRGGAAGGRTGRNSIQLGGALSRLATHVDEMKTQKMVQTITRMMTANGSGTDGFAGKSCLAAKYLDPVDVALMRKHRETSADAGTGSASGASSKANVTAPAGDGESAKSGDKDAQDVDDDEIKDAFAPAAVHNLRLHQADPAVIDMGLMQLMHKFGGDKTQNRISLINFARISRFTDPTVANISASGPQLTSSKAKATFGGIGTGVINFYRFLDSDHDGYITVQDVRSAYVQILQRSDAYLRVAFGMYVDALWYPGCRLNYFHAVHAASTGDAATTAASRRGSRAQQSQPPQQTPQKLSQQQKQQQNTHTPMKAAQSHQGKSGAKLEDLTHSARVRRSMEPDSDDDAQSDAAAAMAMPPPSSLLPQQQDQDQQNQQDRQQDQLEDQQVRQSVTEEELLEVIWSDKPELAEEQEEQLYDEHNSKKVLPPREQGQSALTYVVEPPKLITGKHVATIFEKKGYNPAHGYIVFELLCDALSRFDLKRTTSVSPTDVGGIDGAAGASDDAAPGAGAGGASGKTGVIRDKKLHVDVTRRSDRRMDVYDFIRAAQLDDVLVQALFRRGHHKFLGMITAAQANQQKDGAVGSGSETGAGLSMAPAAPHPSGTTNRHSLDDECSRGASVARDESTSNDDDLVQLLQKAIGIDGVMSYEGHKFYKG